MKRMLTLALFAGLVVGGAGCGNSGANAVPEKATSEMIEAQKKEQQQADEGELQFQKNKKKR